MKRSIIISLLTVLTLPAAACIWFGDYNDYLYRIYAVNEFRDRVDRITEDNWKAYLGPDASEYFWFDADALIEVAQGRGDDLMASYIKYLRMYLDCAKSVSNEDWEYPTKEKLGEDFQTLTNIRLYAQSKLKSRLRSQHGLLFMRCNMLMGKHDENVRFYDETGSKFIESVYRDMMKNIYAGALLHTGRPAEASQIFGEQGDWQSLMTQFYERRSCEAIRTEYERDPNSTVLPFLLQDFVNNTQEAYDAQDETPGSFGGKLFIRDIERPEAMSMIELATRVINEGKTRQPAMWQTAKAWIEYLFADRLQALKDINEAVKLDGTDQQLECARVIRFYIKTSVEPLTQHLDNFVAQELEWMEQKMKDVSDIKWYDGYPFYAARERIMCQNLHDKYVASGRPELTLALFNAADSHYYHETVEAWGPDTLISYINFIEAPAENDLERYVKARAKINADEINDIIGAKFLQERNWEKAIEWLQKVPAAFYAERGYAPYAALRRWTVEPWVHRQWLFDEQVWGDNAAKPDNNPRLAFAKEMQAKEAGLNLLKGDIRYQRCFDLAVRYAQADITGDCWFLLSDTKSTYDERMHPYAEHAVELLQEAAKSKDFYLRERALFALSYVYLNKSRWYEAEWNRETRDFNWIPQPATDQYAAFTALYQHEQQNPGRLSDYVSRCDDYRQFVKHQK